MLAALTALIVLEAGWLVVFYNRIVNLDHAAVELRAKVQAAEAESGELKSTLFSLLENSALDDFARERNLVQEKKPHYVTVNQLWPVSR